MAYDIAVVALVVAGIWKACYLVQNLQLTNVAEGVVVALALAACGGAIVLIGKAFDAIPDDSFPDRLIRWGSRK